MGSLTFTRPNGLTPAQFKAIEFVAAGLTDVGVAERVGVTRETVTRWRLYDPTFKAAVGQRRAEQLAGIADSIRGVLPEALDTVREQLRVGRSRDRLALDLLTRAGVMGTPRTGGLTAADGLLGVGPTTVEEVLDAEVRRTRAVDEAEHGFDSMLPPVGAPITNEEREAAYLALTALATGESHAPNGEQAHK